MENLRNLVNLAYVLEQVDSLRIGFCYDCAHHYRHYPDDDLLSMFGSRLMALHLHDNKGDDRHLLPFDGTVDWPAAMEKIAATGYAGATAIEAMNWKYRDLAVEEFLREAFARGKRLASLQTTLAS